MAGRRGGGNGWHDLWSMIVALILLGVLMVGLVSSGGWRVLSGRLGIGNPDAHTSDLTKDRGGVERNPDARDVTKLLQGLKGSGAQAAPQPGTPAPVPDGNAGKAPDAKTDTADAKTGMAYWQAQLDATGGIRTAKANPGGYDRESEFGGWAPANCGKATTRDLILARDLTDVSRDSSCRVASGTLADPYTGRGIAFRRGVKTSAAVQIDHVVSLYDAWASGARDWDQGKRVEYANDPDVLLASDGPANMAKGSGIDVNGRSTWLTQHTGAPDIWMPDNKAYRCDYMAKRVGIKTKYGLTMTAREKQQTITYLAGCVAGKNR